MTASGYDVHITREPSTGPVGRLLREFLAYMRDPSAQLVIRRAGFVDQAPEEIRIDEQGDRFANSVLRAGPEVSLKELQRISIEVMDDEAAKDPSFAEILDSQRRFSAQYAHWKRLAYLPRDF